MSTTVLIDKLMDTVVATDLGRPNQDFADAAFALLALAVSKLSPAEREDMLQAIEDGVLRRAVQRFPGAQRNPEVHCGSLH